ncbi:hypothetical protein [Epilithonimonas hispanica]|uniref:Uncharacterized protein n=1 Tax=Epilithonimonas hispanica TaxID=358687 RepID=A0A3D9CIV9_9FLAO|nr:hypothetical protein [Epilithonimonas hispanica]REC65656.1 hypothetical protein DRF58_17720 [Epilithonimonas hispanica]
MKKEISFYDYTFLSQDNQYDLLFSLGEFIDSAEKGSAKYVLYKLFNFYVEVVYDSQNNFVKQISSFLNARNH